MNVVTLIIFCMAVVFAVLIRMFIQRKQDTKELTRNKKQSYVEKELSEKTDMVDNQEKKEVQLGFEVESDPLDGVNLDLYINHIVKMLVYSEVGYQINIDNHGAELFLADKDPLFEEAARLIVFHQQGSTSLIQRKFSIGYSRAGRLMDQLEMAGIVGVTQGSKPREVLIMDEYSLEVKLRSIDIQTFKDDVIDIIEERFYEEILQRKAEYIRKIKEDLRVEQEQKIEDEKEIIRKKLLEKERKKQLEKEIRQDLIDKGLISPD